MAVKFHERHDISWGRRKQSRGGGPGCSFTPEGCGLLLSTGWNNGILGMKDGYGCAPLRGGFQIWDLGLQGKMGKGKI